MWVGSIGANPARIPGKIRPLMMGERISQASKSIDVPSPILLFYQFSTPGRTLLIYLHVSLKHRSSINFPFSSFHVNGYLFLRLDEHRNDYGGEDCRRYVCLLNNKAYSPCFC